MPGLSDPRPFHWGAVASLLALILLTLAWELWLAPLRPGGSWLVLKAAILLLPLMGVLKEKVYTYQWSSMFILAFFEVGRSLTGVMSMLMVPEAGPVLNWSRIRVVMVTSCTLLALGS